MEDNNSLQNYNTYGDTTIQIYHDKLVLTTGTTEYWLLLRLGGSVKPLSELQGETIIFHCDFECEQTVYFESNVNNTIQYVTSNGEVTMTVPLDATSAYFAIKSQNTVIHVDNIQVYIQ